MELRMTVNESWVYQGRQGHGYSGTGTALKDDEIDETAGANDLFRPANAGQRVDYVASSLIMHVPRNNRGRWNSAVSDSARANLKTTVATWYGARSSSRDAFRSQFLDPYTSDDVVDRLRSAAKDMVEGRTHDDLAKAGDGLDAAAQKVGVDSWPRSLGNASHQAVRSRVQGRCARGSKSQRLGRASSDRWPDVPWPPGDHLRNLRAKHVGAIQNILAAIRSFPAAGDSPYSAGGYQPWPNQDRTAVMHRIRSEWMDLSRSPSIPDIAWFGPAKQA